MAGLALAALVVAALPPSAAQAPAALDVTMHNDDSFYFMVAGYAGKNPTLQLEAGTVYDVTVTNMGTVPHDLNFGTSGGSSLLDPGASESFTFTASAGITEYWCNPHRSAGMSGVVEVSGGDEASPGLGMLAPLGALAAVFVVRRYR